MAPDSRNAPKEALSFVDSMKTVFKEAAPEKQKALNDLLLETVVLFDMDEDDQLLMKQLEYLIALKVSAIPETLRSRCKQVLEQQWRPYDRPSRILSARWCCCSVSTPRRRWLLRRRVVRR